MPMLPIHDVSRYLYVEKWTIRGDDSLSSIIKSYKTDEITAAKAFLLGGESRIMAETGVGESTEASWRDTVSEIIPRTKVSWLSCLHSSNGHQDRLHGYSEGERRLHNS